MKVVWQRPSLWLAREIIRRLARNTKWGAATVKTMLNRLVRKRALQ